MDDYNHTFSPNNKFVKGNYLELHMETKVGDLHYVDGKKIAIISCFSVAGICLNLETLAEKQKNRKEITMHVVTHSGSAAI